MTAEQQSKISDRLDEAEVDAEKINDQLIKFKIFKSKHPKNQFKSKEIIKALQRSYTMPITADIVSLCVNCCIIISLAIVSTYYPGNARSILIFFFCFFNFCVFVLIKTLRIKKLVSTMFAEYCQQARILVFPFAIQVSTFAALNHIHTDLIVALSFYSISGLLVLCDIIFTMKRFLYNIKMYKSVGKHENDFKPCRFRDKTSDKSNVSQMNNVEMKDDDNQHLQIELIPPV